MPNTLEPGAGVVTINMLIHMSFAPVQHVFVADRPYKILRTAFTHAFTFSATSTVQLYINQPHINLAPPETAVLEVPWNISLPRRIPYARGPDDLRRFRMVRGDVLSVRVVGNPNGRVGNLMVTLLPLDTSPDFEPE